MTTPSPTPEQIEALADAMVQLLDDMGEHGKCVCGVAKAEARIAIEPFLNEDRTMAGLMPLQEALAIQWECDHPTALDEHNPYRQAAMAVRREK